MMIIKYIICIIAILIIIIGLQSGNIGILLPGILAAAVGVLYNEEHHEYVKNLISGEGEPVKRNYTCLSFTKLYNWKNSAYYIEDVNGYQLVVIPAGTVLFRGTSVLNRNNEGYYFGEFGVGALYAFGRKSHAPYNGIINVYHAKRDIRLLDCSHKKNFKILRKTYDDIPKIEKYKNSGDRNITRIIDRITEDKNNDSDIIELAFGDPVVEYNRSSFFQTDIIFEKWLKGKNYFDGFAGVDYEGKLHPEVMISKPSEVLQKEVIAYNHIHGDYNYLYGYNINTNDQIDKIEVDLISIDGEMIGKKLKDNMSLEKITNV